MRTLLILFLVTASCFANYVKESELVSGDIKTVYLNPKSCGIGCIKIPYGYNKNYHKKMEIMEDDRTKPNYELASQSEPCSGESDCQEKLEAKECPVSQTAYMYKKYISTGNDSVYCTKIVSYKKKGTGRYSVREDSSLKSSYQAQATAKKAELASIEGQVKYMESGKRIYAAIQLLSKSKGLSKAQRRQFRKDNKDIKDDLLEGNLCNAKSDIQAMPVDGVLITNQLEIDSIVAKIDSIISCP